MLDGLAGGCHGRRVAVRNDIRLAPDMGLFARAARAFAYVLLVITCTVIAALGGYQIGLRSRPSEGQVSAERAHAVRAAVDRAVAARGSADRAAFDLIVARRLRARHDEDMALLQRRLDEQHIADGELAARAFVRGRAAGRTAAEARRRTRAQSAGGAEAKARKAPR